MTLYLEILKERLVYNIQRILFEGGVGNHLIVSTGEFYIQIPSEKGQSQVIVECVSNEFLPPELQLDSKGYFMMGKLGFDLPDPENNPNFNRIADVSNWEALNNLADQIIHIFTEVYHADFGNAMEFQINLE